MENGFKWKIGAPLPVSDTVYPSSTSVAAAFGDFFIIQAGILNGKAQLLKSSFVNFLRLFGEIVFHITILAFCPKIQ